MRESDFDPAHFDPRDPNPWLALKLDSSMPIDEDAKAALLRGNASWSRRWMFNIVRVPIFLFFLVVKFLRAVSPHHPNLNTALHKLIHWGLRNFATRDANFLIMRHFHIGTEILGFIKANAGVPEIETVPLKPRTLKDLENNVFLQHDLNVYNFIIQLNMGLRAQKRDLSPVARPDFSMITDGPFDIELAPDGALNFADAQTAIEAYTPLYALFLPRKDFIRASNSLQLDETVAIYLAKLLGSNYHLAFVENHHPMVQLSTMQAGYRLMMHGLDCEALHGWLRTMKRAQATGEPVFGLAR
ncbi:MAG TPA: hypothetical protein VGU69_03030 [Rhizomicrobium sp.]|nr:hypothetical protein [Rhizomicrobium sp.]